VKADKCGATSGKSGTRGHSPEKPSRRKTAKKESEKPSGHSTADKGVRDTSSNKKSAQSTPKVEIPSVAYRADGIPSIFCRLDLSRLSKIPIPGGPGKRPSGGEDIRVRTELADTRQQALSDADYSSRRNKKKRTQSPSCEEGDIVIPKCDNDKNTDTVVQDHGYDSTVVNHEASQKQKKRKGSRNRDSSNSKNHPEVRDTSTTATEG
jgi:hypothetical protein